MEKSVSRLSLWITVALPSTVPPKTWAGSFIGRLGDNQVVDRATITGAGFTILSEEESAGQTTFYVYANISVIRKWIRNLLVTRYELPYFFFLLPRGEPFTPDLVYRWINIEGLLR